MMDESIEYMEWITYCVIVTNVYDGWLIDIVICKTTPFWLENFHFNAEQAFK